MFITVKIERLKPDTSYGRLANYTEVIVAPYKNTDNKLNDIQTVTTQQIIERSKSQHSIASNGHHNGRPTSMVFTKPGPVKIHNKIHSLDSLLTDLKKQNNKQFQFRVISSKWADSQICDLYLTRHNLPKSLDISQVFCLRTNDKQEYFVNIKVLGEQELFPQNIYQTIEMNDILMKKLSLREFEWVQLKSKATLLNSVEKIELSPSKKVDYEGSRDIEQLFKQLIIDNTTLYPLLINQAQVYKLKYDLYVTVNLQPEIFRFGLVDSAILREIRIQCVDKVKDVVLPQQNGILPSASFSKGFAGQQKTVLLQKYEQIIDDCVKSIKTNLCLDDQNSFRKMGNIMIVGKFWY